MPSKVLFVDYENVTRVDLAKIPDDAIVHMFLGAVHKTVPREIYSAARKLGNRCIDIVVPGKGKNALDFLIAYYLGNYLTRNPDADCVILSKDTGFDPLIEHLCGQGLKVRRVDDQSQALATSAKPDVVAAKVPKATAKKALAKVAPKAKPTETLQDRVRRMWELLHRADARLRPRKRKGLIAHVANHFKDQPESGVQKIVDALFADGRIRESDGALVYAP